MVGKWRHIDERTVFQDRWIHLTASRFEYAGREIDPYYLLRCPDWVMVVALTPERRVVLVRQYRPGPDAVVLEFPTGTVEARDSGPCDAGWRELREESGFGGGDGRLLEPMTVDSSRVRNRCHVMVVNGAEPQGEQRLDDTEWMEVELVEIGDLERMIDRGEIAMGAMIGAWYRAKLRFPEWFVPE